MLATQDITSFYFRSKPNTLELLEQKLQSLKGFARCWYEVLSAGYIDCTNPTGAFESWEDERFVTTVRINEAYNRHLSKSKQYQTIQHKEISGGLKRWCPNAAKTRGTDGGSSKRGYQLPSLDEARVAFEVAIGGKIDWGDEAD